MAEAGDSSEIRRSRGFYGRFRIKLDAKGRLTLPAVYRRSLGAGETDDAGLVLRQGTDGFVQVVPEAEFDRHARSKAIGGGGDLAARQWQKRMQLSSVGNVSLDPKGRITVPAPLLERNGIGREVLVLGVGRLMEIWDPDTFFALEKQQKVETAALDELLYD